MARSRLLLGLGAAVGLALATGAIVERGPNAGLPSDTAALVNGVAISSANYERALAALASDSREPLDDAQRRRVLDRLVEEELLVQRARDLGMDRHDRRVRSLLVADIIDSIVAETASLEPDPDAIADFYRENGNFFRRSGRLWVRQVFVDVDGRASEADARARAQEAAGRLRAGADFEQVAHDLGDPEVAELPDGLLPATQLRNYLGPTPARRALALTAGEVSEPVRGGSGYHVLQMVEREPDWLPPLADVQPQVMAEMRRRAGDQALRDYLDRLRAQADVRLAGP